MASNGYPARPEDFAERFVRLLVKAGVADTLGTDVCWFLMVIVHDEHARGFRGPARFRAAKLGPIVGTLSESNLERLREKAVGAGWLRYEPGREGTPPRYWVSIPAEWRGPDVPPADQRPEGA